MRPTWTAGKAPSWASTPRSGCVCRPSRAPSWPGSTSWTPTKAASPPPATWASSPTLPKPPAPPRTTSPTSASAPATASGPSVCPQAGRLSTIPAHPPRSAEFPGHRGPMTELPDGLHGAHRRTDLIQHLGLRTVRALVRDGLLVRPTRAAAALLHVGPSSALASHTAALVYGCTAADSARIHLLCGPDRAVAARPGLVLHIGALDPGDVLTLDGLRVLGLEMVIAELLCGVDRQLGLACAGQ